MLTATQQHLNKIWKNFLSQNFCIIAGVIDIGE